MSDPDSRLSGPGDTVAKNMPPLLRESDDMVMALLEASSQGIFSIDREGRIVLANRLAGEMFAYSQDELIGARFDMIVPECWPAALAGEPGESLSPPGIRTAGIAQERSGRRKDGSEFPIEISVSTIATEKGLFGIAFISDISQLKLMEEELLRVHKMEAVSRLAGGVAHDFNNVLTIISGYSRMILDELSPLDPLRGNAEEILKAAERAAALTNQMLAFSRRQIVRPRVLNVNATLGNIQKMLRRLIVEDIELVLKPAQEVANIRADPTHLEQAIVNLAANARDAMPAGGRITIECANVHLDETYTRTHPGVQPGDFVMIAVSDTGQGMDAETRRHIFEPFFTTKDPGKGTGLGLATVYGMVKQSGGEIRVYSELGKGSTFKLYFPAVWEPVSESDGNAGEQPEARGSETILVVEDESAVRELAVEMIRQLGYTVLVAASGAEAIEISQLYAGHISLLVTDVVMPNLSGTQLAEALRRARPAMRVLYLSGYSEDTVVRHGVLDAGVDFLPKPFTRETLGGKVRDILTPRC